MASIISTTAKHVARNTVNVVHRGPNGLWVQALPRLHRYMEKVLRISSRKLQNIRKWKIHSQKTWHLPSNIEFAILCGTKNIDSDEASNIANGLL